MTGYPVPPHDTAPQTWAAIDIAKDAHVVLVESPAGRRRFRVANTLADIEALIAFLRAQPQPVRVAFAPTGVYHRPLAYQRHCHVDADDAAAGRDGAPDAPVPHVRPRATRPPRATSRRARA